MISEDLHICAVRTKNCQGASMDHCSFICGHCPAFSGSRQKADAPQAQGLILLFDVLNVLINTSASIASCSMSSASSMNFMSHAKTSAPHPLPPSSQLRHPATDTLRRLQRDAKLPIQTCCIQEMEAATEGATLSAGGT